MCIRDRLSSILERAPLARATLDTQISLPRALGKIDYDLIHFFAHGDAPVWGLGGASTLSVLDLIPLRFPELYQRSKILPRYQLARYLERKAIEGASGLLAISQCTKNDLVQILDVDPGKIAVTPLAVSTRFLEQVPVGSVGKRTREAEKYREQNGFGFDDKVVAYLGGLDPRKNVLFLLDLLKRLTEEMREPPFLLLAGDYSQQKEYPQLKSRISELGLQNRVVEAGFVDDINLVSFYQAADLFLFPSLYEGFGFPVLEAMAAGTVVVAGKNSSMPELSDGSFQGEKGIFLLEDDNIGVWVRTVRDLFGASSKLGEIGGAGNKRAHEFTWKRTARLTVEAWKEFGKSSASSE